MQCSTGKQSEPGRSHIACAAEHHGPWILSSRLHKGDWKPYTTSNINLYISTKCEEVVEIPKQHTR